MGKNKDAAWDWLEECGWELGYDWDCLPKLDQLENIK